MPIRQNPNFANKMTTHLMISSPKPAEAQQRVSNQLEDDCQRLSRELARISKEICEYETDDSDSSAVSSGSLVSSDAMSSSLVSSNEDEFQDTNLTSDSNQRNQPVTNYETNNLTNLKSTTTIEIQSQQPQQQQQQQPSSSLLVTKAAMPRRSRSLVDDARLDTQRNKQLLDEIRREQQLVRASMEVPDEEAESGDTMLQQSKLAMPSGDNNDNLASVTNLSSLNDQQLPQRQATIVEEEDDDEAKQAERYLSDFPRHISDLDHCNHLLIKYEPELDPTHPGFHDVEYRLRRKEVAEVAFNYRHGERIPDIDYSDKERDTWRQIYLKLRQAYEKYACDQHNKAIAQLEAEGVYSPDQIPQLQQVSEFLERRTGWRLRPVAGLLSARDFLASLAFRVFQTTQYIRHWGNPEHSVEPDCIHELMGHIPMLCDPNFAQFSQELGLASLGASDEQIEKFATLYWFTVEFGLCREFGQLKCYGAGLLSSYGEMEHALESGKPKLKEFVPEETALETYDDSEYQVVYYVAKSFNDAKSKMRDYAANNLDRKHELAYDPYTCSIKELCSYDQLESYTNAIRSDMNRLSSALERLKMAQAALPQATANGCDQAPPPLTVPSSTSAAAAAAAAVIS